MWCQDPDINSGLAPRAYAFARHSAAAAEGTYTTHLFGDSSLTPKPPQVYIPSEKKQGVPLQSSLEAHLLCQHLLLSRLPLLSPIHAQEEILGEIQLGSTLLQCPCKIESQLSNYEASMLSADLSGFPGVCQEVNRSSIHTTFPTPTLPCVSDILPAWEYQPVSELLR